MFSQEFCAPRHWRLRRVGDRRETPHSGWESPRASSQTWAPAAPTTSRLDPIPDHRQWLGWTGMRSGREYWPTMDEQFLRFAFADSDPGPYGRVEIRRTSAAQATTPCRCTVGQA